MIEHRAHGPQEPPTPAVSDGMNQGMRVLSSLIAGVLLYGGLGWLGDHFFDTRFLLPLGIVIGAAFGAYVSIKRVTATLASETAAAAAEPVTTARKTRGGRQ